MPDIIVHGDPVYDKLTKSQKDLIQAIVTHNPEIL